MTLAEVLHDNRCQGCRCKSGDIAGELYRCDDCLGRGALCAQCLLHGHRFLPLHNIQKWDRLHRCFVPHSLCEMGLILDLPHVDYSTCSSRSSTHLITVMHTNGIHKIAIRYCACEGGRLQPDERRSLDGPKVTCKARC